MQPTIAANTLFYGDNLPILREYIPDESIDLLYLDPPFNSNRNYNVLFKDESGRESLPTRLRRGRSGSSRKQTAPPPVYCYLRNTNGANPRLHPPHPTRRTLPGQAL